MEPSRRPRTGQWLAPLVTLSLVVGCHYETSATSLPAERNGASPLTAKQAYPVASGWAAAWRKGAYLSRVIILLAGDQIERGPEKITFIFQTDHALGPFHWWDAAFVGVDSQTGAVTTTSVYEWQTHSQQGPHADIARAILDSSDALRLAEERGGRAYRQERPDAMIRITGFNGLGEGQFLWSVWYFRPDAPRPDELGLGIDAGTGEVRTHAYPLPPTPVP
jgi:hypothetical protein